MRFIYVVFSLAAWVIPTLTWADEHTIAQGSNIEKAERSDPGARTSEEQEFERELQACGELEKNSDSWAQEKPENFSDLEWKAINLYLGSGFSCVNKQLREGNAQGARRFISLIDSALQKFPRFTGVSYRGEKPSPFHSLPQKEGDQFQDPAYWSTSAEAQVAATFGSIQYEIHATSCRDLTIVNLAESEVLCPRNTAFRVRSIKKDGNSIKFVVDEVPSKR